MFVVLYLVLRGRFQMGGREQNMSKWIVNVKKRPNKMLHKNLFNVKICITL